MAESDFFDNTEGPYTTQGTLKDANYSFSHSLSAKHELHESLSNTEHDSFSRMRALYGIHAAFRAHKERQYTFSRRGSILSPNNLLGEVLSGKNGDIDVWDITHGTIILFFVGPAF